MTGKLPSILVTGASGIVGRNFLEAAKTDFIIYALARRSQKEAGVAEHPNIKWIQVDIGNLLYLKWYTMNTVKSEGRVDFVLHLAGYYDFNYRDHPEYERTNVKGTGNVLELARQLRVKRFVFASSLAACRFPAKGTRITEKCPADADYPYAWSKKKGETLVREFSKYFPCSIVRFAAVFTDWCEYGLLYALLFAWFSRRWCSRLLAGRGESSIPYIYTLDLNRLLLTILKNSDRLPVLGTYNASPDGSTSHREIFDTATRFYYGRSVRPLCLPKTVICPGMVIRDCWGRLIGNRPFERPWMAKYFDRRLEVDASYTRKILSWEPMPRFHVLRRLLYLIERMKSNPQEWHTKNELALKRISLRPGMQIYETMVRLRGEIVYDIKNTLLNSGRKEEFSHYQKLGKDTFNWDVETFYQLLTASVRNKDRLILINYARDLLAPIRFREGFCSREVCTAMLDTGKIVISRLLRESDLKDMEQFIYDYIVLTIQMTVDEVENVFERLTGAAVVDHGPSRNDIEDRIRELATLQTPPSGKSN